MFRNKVLCGTGILLITLSILGGCGEEGPSVEESLMSGRFVCLPAVADDTRSGRYVMPGNPKGLPAELILDENGDFVMRLLNKDMQPLSPPQEASGTWATDGALLKLNISDNSFSGDYAIHAPTSTGKVGAESLGADYDYVLIQNQRSVVYRFIRPEKAEELQQEDK